MKYVYTSRKITDVTAVTSVFNAETMVYETKQFPTIQVEGSTTTTDCRRAYADKGIKLPTGCEFIKVDAGSVRYRVPYDVFIGVAEVVPD